jgi:hypothetical protein
MCLILNRNKLERSWIYIEKYFYIKNWNAIIQIVLYFSTVFGSGPSENRGLGVMGEDWELV